MVDNHGYILSPLEVQSINQHDTRLFPDSFEKLLDWFDLLGIRNDLKGSYLTLDTGFDSKRNKNIILDFDLKPVIRPNRRRVKNQEKIEEMFTDFPENIYKERYKIERTFGWKHKYRRLVIRYEKLQVMSLGLRLLAYSMINYREFV